MPLLLDDFKLTPEEELGHSRLMNYLYPEYSHQSWSLKLKNNGLSLDMMAQLYTESLMNVSPALKLKAIERMLSIMGVDAKIDAAKEIGKSQTPQIVINLQSGGQANLLQMVAPKREFDNPLIDLAPENEENELEE